MDKKLVLLSIIVILSILPVANQVYSQSTGTPSYNPPAEPIKFEEIVNRIKDILWVIFWGIIIIMFIVIGILYLTSQGNPEKIQKANRSLIWATIGVAVGVLAFSAYEIIKGLIFG